MIKVNRRSVTCPMILAKNQAIWTREYLQIRLAIDKANAPKRRSELKARIKRLEARYGHISIRQALGSLFRDKCAYCESRIAHVLYPHVEHFRPKSKSPLFAYRWSNLLLACGVCNGPQYKGDKFPGKKHRGPLINPCRDDPSVHFDFLFDTVAQIAEIVPKTARGATTESILGLNRPELIKYRSTQVKRVYALSLLARKNNDPAGLALLDEASRADAEYSAFMKCL